MYLLRSDRTRDWLRLKLIDLLKLMMMLFVYNLLFHLALPFLLLRLWLRSRQAPAYRERILERFGVNDIQLNESIWVHTVSVGEFIAALSLIKKLQRRYPDVPMVVTTMTPTGSEQVLKSLGSSVHHCYLPYDFFWAQRRLIKKLKPKALIVLETELWPNLLLEAKRALVPVIVANARLSEKSAAGYGRLLPLTQKIFHCIDQLAVQAEADAQRFQDLGMPNEKMKVTGSIKSDLQVSEAQREVARNCRMQWGHMRPVIIAASTHLGEDEKVLAAFQQVLKSLPDALLVLVPRHPERFNSVAALIEQMQFSMQRRSHNDAELSTQTQVLLGDTMGELMVMLGASDVAFVGGSLVSNGGHNVLEPIAFDIPVVVGPSMFNFQTIFNELHEQAAILQIEDSEELARAWLTLLTDSVVRDGVVEKAAGIMKKNQGALDKLLAIIDAEL